MEVSNLKNIPLLVTAISLTLFTTNVYSDWGVGIGVGNQSNEYIDKKDDIEISALIGLRYQGEKFNMGKDGVSYDFSNTEKYTIELLLDTNNFGYEAKNSATFTGMDERKTSIDVGGRVIVDTGFIGNAVLEVTKDIHASKGYEANIKIGGLKPNRPHWTGERKLEVAAVAGVRYQDSKTVDYYYGVKSSEATASRAAYQGKSAITPYIGVEAQANLTPHITLDGGLGVYKRAKSIRNSSITNDKKYDVGANIGFSYWF